MMDMTSLEAALSDLPLYEYFEFTTDELTFSDRIRWICEHECPMYGKSWACPPGVGTVGNCKVRCLGYKKGLCVSTIVEVADISDIDETLATRPDHEAVTERGDTRFSRYPALKNGDHCEWCDTTISQILKNPVYTGTLINLKTEITNYKTKRKTPVPPERQIVIPNAHEAIIDAVQFEHVQEVRARNKCAANDHRFNLFRGKLFCECCGHPLAISKKQLKYREADIYLCMYHYAHPEVCPKTHRVYHDMLYPYVLQQVQLFAKSMKRRKVNSKISEYATINELTPAVLDAVIDRIEIGHVKYKSKPGNVIRIFWKL